MKNKTSVCVLCSHNCGITVSSKNNKIISIKPDKNNPRTKGYICNKGYTLPYYNDHKQRVLAPLKKNDDGTYSEISWDKVISEIGDSLKDILHTYGPDSFALCGIGGQANHLDTLYALSFLKATKSRWWFNALAQEKTQHNLVDQLLFKASSNSWYHVDYENSDYLLMLGTNPLVSNRGLRPSKFLADFSKNENRTLVVVDPRKTETAKKAKLHLAIRPGTDAYFLMGLIKTIIDKAYCNLNFINKHCNDFQSLKEIFSSVDVKEMSKISNIKFSIIEKIAKDFSASSKAGVFFDLGVEQTLNSTLISYLIRILSILTGNIGEEGQNIFQGLFIPASPLSLEVPTAKQSSIKGITAMGPFAMFSTNLIAEEILNDGEEKIRSMIVEGSNPMLSAADTKTLGKALSSLDLLVVIDPVMSETAMLAHYVLPSPSAYEKWEYSAFPSAYPEIFVQLRPPVLEKPRKTFSEAEIYFRIAKSAGLIQELPQLLKQSYDFINNLNFADDLKAKAILSLCSSYSTLKSIPKLDLKQLFFQDNNFSKEKVNNLLENFIGQNMAHMVFALYELLQDELQDASLTSLYILSHVYSLTNRQDILRALTDLNFKEKFNLGTTTFQKLLEHPQGLVLSKLNAKKNLQNNLGNKDKKINLLPLPFNNLIKEALANPPKKNKHFPFILDAGFRTNKNANTIQRNPAWRKGKEPFCFIAIHPVDAKSLSLENGDLVKVTNTDSVSFSISVKIDNRTIPGSVHIPNGFGVKYPDENNKLVSDGINLNEFTNASYRDSITGIPYHKYIEVKIEKI